MTRARGDIIAYVVSGLAILAFALVLIFALVRLLETETEMRRNAGDNMLWAIAQAQKATLRLDGAVTRRANAENSVDDLKLRYNVLLSRLTLLSQGPQRRYMADLGHGDSLARRGMAVRDLKTEITGLSYGDVETASEVHDILKPLAREFGHAANQSMVTHWNATGARLDAQHNALVEVTVSIVAIIVLGAFISVIMLRAMAAKQRAQRSLAREQEIGEAYRSFVALVSHQFRTPLAVIDSAMQRLLRQSHTLSCEEIGKRARHTRSEVHGLIQLIDTTLEAMRLDAGHVEIKPQECEIGDLIERIRSRQLQATPTRLITLAIGDEVPPRLTTDPLLVEQVLGNLLSNAVKYSPGNEPVAMRVRAESNRIRFSVEDRGLGIPDDEHERLFHRFFRASTAAGIPGFGVGLSVSSQLARILGGHLDFVSRSGVGSTFTLALPDMAGALPDMAGS